MESYEKPCGLGLVLSGGGVKGLVHVGVLKFLEEEGIEVEAVAGASIGAIVGALHNAGHKAEDIFRFFEETRIFKSDHITLLRPGIIDGMKLKMKFLPWFEKNDFGSLQKPLYVTATEITKGRLKVFDRGPLIEAVIASSAFPLLFTPVELDGGIYLDGGIMNHFPSDLLKDRCRKLLGVFLSPVEELPPSELDSMAAIVERTFKLGRLASSLKNMELVDFIINPGELVEYNTFSIRNKAYKELYELGYRHAAKNAEIIRALAEMAKEKS